MPAPSACPELGLSTFWGPFATDHDYFVNRQASGKTQYQLLISIYP